MTNISPKLRRVSLVVTPTTIRCCSPDSVVFERSISGRSLHH